MFAEMGERDFVEFLAALWESRGWQTGITERDEGVYMLTGDKPDGQRGLMLVVPDPEATVTGQMTQKLVTLVREKGIDMGVAATRGDFSDDARGIADANGVHLLDTDALAQTVESEGLADLVEEYSNGGGGEDGSITDRLPAIGLPAVGGAVGRLRTGLVVVVVLAVILAGVQFLGMGAAVGGVFAGLPLPDVGIGGGAGGYTITAVSLSEGNSTPAQVAWDARTQSSVVAPNGQSFESPEGKKFVVVQFNVTNPSGESMVFRANHLALATQNTRYGNQPLQGASGQLPIIVEAESAGEGYVVFTVPEDSEAATLLGLPGPDVPPIQFERDRSLAFQVD